MSITYSPSGSAISAGAAYQTEINVATARANYYTDFIADEQLIGTFAANEADAQLHQIQNQADELRATGYASIAQGGAGIAMTAGSWIYSSHLESQADECNKEVDNIKNQIKDANDQLNELDKPSNVKGTFAAAPDVGNNSVNPSALPAAPVSAPPAPVSASSPPDSAPDPIEVNLEGENSPLNNAPCKTKTELNRDLQNLKNEFEVQQQKEQNIRGHSNNSLARWNAFSQTGASLSNGLGQIMEAKVKTEEAQNAQQVALQQGNAQINGQTVQVDSGLIQSMDSEAAQVLQTQSASQAACSAGYLRG